MIPGQGRIYELTAHERHLKVVIVCGVFFKLRLSSSGACLSENMVESADVESVDGASSLKFTHLAS